MYYRRMSDFEAAAELNGPARMGDRILIRTDGVFERQDGPMPPPPPRRWYHKLFGTQPTDDVLREF